MSPALSFLLPALVLAQAPAPFERSDVDPFLPDTLRPVVELAIQAELDPKRGPGNAMAVLSEAMREHGDDDGALLTLRLRQAGVVLRKRFMEDRNFPEALRYEQAISTFTRLDLREPGLEQWLKAALQHHPEGNKRVEAVKRTIPISVLARGQGVDRKQIAQQLVAAIAELGFKAKVVPPKNARFVLKVATENPKTPVPGRHAVRVILGIEEIINGKVGWTHTIFRTEAAAEAQTAIDAGVQWLLRVGGRDMFFYWLGKTAFPSLVARPDHQRESGPGHAGHGH